MAAAAAAASSLPPAVGSTARTAATAARVGVLPLVLRFAQGIAMRHPLLLLLAMRILRELYRLWVRRRQYWLGYLRVRCIADEIDAEMIQGCLLSTENLLSLGRVEKRTIFDRQLLDVFQGNVYLVQELLRGARQCRQQGRNCMVTRWLPPDERYHVLQACLNVVSSLFGANYVHFNALDGEHSNLFKSTWYCLTVSTPMRPDNKAQELLQRSASKQALAANQTCTFTDMSRMPRATLRVLLVNETDLRRIADGKLNPPSWGFFNSRHAERYRMLLDFSRNFQKQLVRTSVDSSSASSRSPFTSERAHPHKSSGPDGGLMKRVQSQPHLVQGVSNSSLHSLSTGRSARGGRNLVEAARQVAEERVAQREESQREGAVDGAAEECCFLRLHIPHFVGQKALASAPQVVVVNNDHNDVQAATAAGLRKVRSWATMASQDVAGTPCASSPSKFANHDMGMSRLVS